MEAILSSDDSCDSEIKNMKSQLSAYGLDEENLTKEEMSDLLKALNNSKSSAKEDDLLREKTDEVVPITTAKKTMKRRYLNVVDRRMPWSLFPNTLTQAEKARTLAVYIKLMSINKYRQARLSPNFMSWPPPIQIVEETTTRAQPVRSTRSGRSVPIYAGFDEDSSDVELIPNKVKKRKISNSEIPESLSGKTISLKRKPTAKYECERPIKEAKLTPDKKDSAMSLNNPKSIFSFTFED